MGFDAIKASKLDVETFNRSEQNTKKAFEDLEQNRQLPISIVTSSASLASYVVKPSDLFVVVNANGGPMKIVLPAPPGPTQSVSIKATGRAISIVQSDSKFTPINLAVGKSIQMVNTGKAWEAFGG